MIRSSQNARTYEACSRTHHILDLGVHFVLYFWIKCQKSEREGKGMCSSLKRQRHQYVGSLFNIINTLTSCPANRNKKALPGRCIKHLSPTKLKDLPVTSESDNPFPSSAESASLALSRTLKRLLFDVDRPSVSVAWLSESFLSFRPAAIISMRCFWNQVVVG